MYTIALAREGCSVVAVDSSPAPREVLQSAAHGLPVRTAHDDLLALSRHLDSKADRILCMGDRPFYSGGGAVHLTEGEYFAPNAVL